MSKSQQNKTISSETGLGFHFMRKSANCLAQDLNYFYKEIDNFDDEQICRFIGFIDEVESNIKKIKFRVLKNIK